MKRSPIISAFLLGLLVAGTIWFAMFVWSGLPGNFDPQGLFIGKGPDLGGEDFACIEPGGALKLYRSPCNLFAYIGDRIIWAIPYYLLSILFLERPAVFSVIIFWISSIIFWLLLGQRHSTVNKVE